MRWPEPPELTRIEFVRAIGSADDLRERSSLAAAGEWLGLPAEGEGKPLVQPVGVAVSADGATVYVSDFAEGLIHVFDLERRATRYLGGPNGFARPFGLAADRSGRVWLVEQGNHLVRVLDGAGNTLRSFGASELVRPIGIALDEERGRVYVADGASQASQDHYVRVFDLEGRFLRNVGAGRGTDPGQLLFPSYVAVGPAGRVYVSDTMNARVSVFSADGEFERAIGGRGDGAGSFDKPKGIAFDAFGNLYVVDSSWSNVQIFGPRDDVLLFFGGRGGLPGLLRNPTGIAISPNNEIFVGDYLNRRFGVYRLVNTGPGDGVPAEPTAAAGLPTAQSHPH